MSQELNANEPTYRIGAVSRLTGISAETLRMWERRYSVVKPSRSGGRNRLYTHDDIGRLALLKRLVDAGDSIGSVAHLTLDQLQERINVHKAQGSLVSSEQDRKKVKPRVAILGDALPALINQRGNQLEDIQFVAVHRDLQRFETDVEALHPDIIILEYPTLHPETVADVNVLLTRSGAQNALVVYGFGTQSAVRRLDTPQTMPMRAPVDLPELRQAIFAVSGYETHKSLTITEEQLANFDSALLPARQFTNEALARIATLSTAVQCECPHHLVELIRSLAAFETYSAECKVSSPKDTALHAALEATTAHARMLMERALAQVVEAEKLDI